MSSSAVAVLAVRARSVDGLLDLEGAGLQRLSVTELPARVPPLGIGLVLSLTGDGPHRLELTVVDPGGALLPIAARTLDDGTTDGVSTLGLDVPAGEESGATFALTLSDLVVEALGEHAVVLTWDGAEVQRLPLHVGLAASGA